MSNQETPDLLAFYGRILLVILLIAGAGVMGIWLGRLSVSDEYSVDSLRPITQQQASGTRTGEADATSVIGLDVPLYFHLGVLNETTWDVLEDEITMAANAGIHQYIIPFDASWGSLGKFEETLLRIDMIVALDARASFLLQVNLNPPLEWLQENPSEQILIGDSLRNYPSPASDWWLLGAQESLTEMVEKLGRYNNQHRIQGVIITALEDGHWLIRGGFDRSLPAKQAFQSWLQRKYGDDALMQSAWHSTDYTFGNAEIPLEMDFTDEESVFYDLLTDQPVIDYLEFQSGLIADVIAMLAAHLKQLIPRDHLVLVPYGFSFELNSNSTGHLALGNLLDSNLDGFISPVSAIDRGLGGAGGMMGPINSAQYHGKRWFLIDDTRTPVSRDPLSGDIARIVGIRSDDVYNVQKRNFAMALLHGLGLVWSDPQGEGWLHDPAQWDVFASMHDAYRLMHNRRLNSDHAAPDAGQIDVDGVDVGDTPTSERPKAYPLPDFQPELLVVVDEISRFYQKCDEPLNRHLLTGMRDSIMRIGLATQFCLLQDVLDGIAPYALNYIFLNAFSLTENEIEILHERLAQNEATAIWMYASGYHSETHMSDDNISNTVGMQVKTFNEPHPSGSNYLLAGRWIAQDAAWGIGGNWYPMFYIDDSEADSLANYTDSGEVSVALRVLESGWTSIYIAEPTATPELLREILGIMEQPIRFRSGSQTFFDTVHISDTLIALHGKSTGERTIVLPETRDIFDLFDPALGWVQRDNFVLSLKSGDTRLFYLD